MEVKQGETEHFSLENILRGIVCGGCAKWIGRPVKIRDWYGPLGSRICSQNDQMAGVREKYRGPLPPGVSRPLQLTC